METGGTDGSGGGPGDAGSDGGTIPDGGTSPSIRYRGGIETVGPIAGTGASPPIRIVNAGLTYPRTRVCSGEVCLSGGIVP